MERKRIVSLFFLILLTLVFSACHRRQLSDIKLDMTKDQVASLWGRTNLVTQKTVDGTTYETWEYHFGGSSSICRITFVQDKVSAGPQCNYLQTGRGYYSQSAQATGSRSSERVLTREGFFAMRLAEALRMGPVNSEADAESILASRGITPKNGWIADYPVTPDIIEELYVAIAAAADSGKIALNKNEAIKAFDGLVAEIENQYAEVEPPPGRQSYADPYSYPYPYRYRYYYADPYPYFPFPYSYRGYYPYYRRYPYPYRAPYYRR